jgi:hypothetical protein
LDKKQTNHTSFSSRAPRNGFNPVSKDHALSYSHLDSDQAEKAYLNQMPTQLNGGIQTTLNASPFVKESEKPPREAKQLDGTIDLNNQVPPSRPHKIFDYIFIQMS